MVIKRYLKNQRKSKHLYPVQHHHIRFRVKFIIFTYSLFQPSLSSFHYCPTSVFACSVKFLLPASTFCGADFSAKWVPEVLKGGNENLEENEWNTEAWWGREISIYTCKIDIAKKWEKKKGKGQRRKPAGFGNDLGETWRIKKFSVSKQNENFENGEK